MIPDTMYIVCSDGTRYNVPLPERGYKVGVHTATITTPVCPKGWQSWDNLAANDYRTCDCTLMVDAATATTLSGVFGNPRKGRGVDVTISLPADSGFYPAGPDKGDSGNFVVRVVGFDPGRVLEEPYGYGQVGLSMVIVSTPAYVLPDEVAEGNLQIGTVTGLCFPADWSQPSTEYAISHQLAEDGTAYAYDRAEKRYSCTLGLTLNESKMAALVNHLAVTVRCANVTVVSPANSYLFGFDKGSSGSYTCRWLDSEISIVHEGNGFWTAPFTFGLVESSIEPYSATVIGVRIYTLADLSAVPNPTDIGLYQNGAVWEIRLIDTEIGGLSPTLTWKAGILLREAIANIGESVDLTIGGNLPVVGGGELKVRNSLDYGGVVTQLDKILQDNDIDLNGMRMDVVEFSVTAGVLADADGTIRFRGFCQAPNWTETEFRVPFETALKKRRSNLATIIDSTNYPNADPEIRGETVPVTFGKHLPQYDTDGNPLYNGFAKFVRTANARNYWRWNASPGQSFTATITCNGPSTMVGRREWCLVPNIAKLTENGVDGQNHVHVTSPLGFTIGESVMVFDTAGSNSRNIVNIIGTVIYFNSTLDRTFLTTRNAKIRVNPSSTTPTTKFSIALESWQRSTLAWYDSGVLQTTGILDVSTAFSGYAFHVIRGTGANQARVIAAAQVDLDADRNVILFTVNDVFETRPLAEVDGCNDNNAWTAILTVNYGYTADTWPCKSYLDTDGTALYASPLSLFAYVAQSVALVTTENVNAPVVTRKLGFYQLPAYALNDTATGNYNAVDIDPRQFDPLSDTIDSFLIKPITAVNLLTTTPVYNTQGLWAFLADNYHNTAPGRYRRDEYAGAYRMEIHEAWEYLAADAASGQPDVEVENGTAFTVGRKVWLLDSLGHFDEKTISLIVGNVLTLNGDLVENFTTANGSYMMQYDPSPDWGRVCDRNYLTYIALRVNYAVSGSTAWLLTFNLPSFPPQGEFDAVYLGIRMDDRAPETDMTIGHHLRASGYMGYPREIHELSASAGARAIHDNLPDWYYQTNVPSTGSVNFWSARDNVVENLVYYVTGYSTLLIPMDKCNEESYRSLSSPLLVWSVQNNPDEGKTKVLKIFEVATIFRKRLSIGDAIYSPFQGRVFDDIWGGRKDGADLIANPIDVIEHICRLQNWSETGQVADWGHVYATTPLIDTSTAEGGFDYEDLNSVKDVQIAWQLMEHSECYSDEMIASLCRQFFLTQYQDPATGNERIGSFAGKSLTAPTVLVTLTQIIKGSIREVTQAEPRGIYCEPYVRYGRNPATGEYDRVIRITHAGAAAFDASYVVGISGSTAELFWTRAHALWLAYRQIEEPPEDMTDCPAIARDVDAIDRLDTWLSWMGATNVDGTPSGVTFQPKKRISFSVPYSIGKDWFLCMHGLLTLPHQTNNVSTEFTIEKLTRVFTEGAERVEVQAILYGASEDIALYIQDTYTPGVLLADWQDVFETQAQDPTQAQDIQDID